MIGISVRDASGAEIFNADNDVIWNVVGVYSIPAGGGTISLPPELANSIFMVLVLGVAGSGDTPRYAINASAPYISFTGGSRAATVTVLVQ